MIYLSRWECKHTLMLMLLMSLNLRCYDSTESSSLSVQTHAFVTWKQTAEPQTKVTFNQTTDFVHVKHSSCCNSQFMLWVLAKKQIADRVVWLQWAFKRPTLSCTHCLIWQWGNLASSGPKTPLNNVWQSSKFLPNFREMYSEINCSWTQCNCKCFSAVSTKTGSTVVTKLNLVHVLYVQYLMKYFSVVHVVWIQSVNIKLLYGKNPMLAKNKKRHSLRVLWKIWDAGRGMGKKHKASRPSVLNVKRCFCYIFIRKMLQNARDVSTMVKTNPSSACLHRKKMEKAFCVHGP